MKGVILLTALLFFLPSALQAQQPESPEIAHRELTQTYDDDLEALPDITKWLPVEKFAQELQSAQESRFKRTTFSTDMVIPKKRVNVVVISPDNSTIKFGSHFSISNGSAGSWGVPYPSAFLDARTLSFPTRR